jgi:hypothetical protein
MFWSPVLWFSLFVVATLSEKSIPDYGKLTGCVTMGDECTYYLRDVVFINRNDRGWGRTALQFWPFGTSGGRSLGLWPFVEFTGIDSHYYSDGFYHNGYQYIKKGESWNSSLWYWDDVRAYQKKFEWNNCWREKRVQLEQFNGILYGYDLGEALVYSLLLPVIWGFRVVTLVILKSLVRLHSMANRMD